MCQNLVRNLLWAKIKKKIESKNATADDILGKMVGEDLKVLPPISKLQARNGIQNVLSKYRTAVTQDSLQRKLNSTAKIDDNFSPSKTGKTQWSNNFENNFQAYFSPNFSTKSSGGSHHWMHGINVNNSLQRKLNSTAMVDDNFSPSKTEKTQSSNNFGNNFQVNFSPNSSTNYSGGSHHWIHGIYTITIFLR